MYDNFSSLPDSDNNSFQVFVVRLLLTPWIFTYGGNTHSLKDVWFSKRIVLMHGKDNFKHPLETWHKHIYASSIIAWGGAQPSHFYTIKDAWELLWHWSFKWRFDNAIKRLNK